MCHELWRVLPEVTEGSRFYYLRRPRSGDRSQRGVRDSPAEASSTPPWWGSLARRLRAPPWDAPLGAVLRQQAGYSLSALRARPQG